MAHKACQFDNPTQDIPAIFVIMLPSARFMMPTDAIPSGIKL
jgi:hypothetical protein